MEEGCFPIGPVHVKDILQVRQGPGVSLILLQVGVGPLAEGARIAREFDLTVRGQFRPLLPLASAQTGLPHRLAGADEDLVALVVEVRTAVDVVEVLECELGAAPLVAA